MRYIKVCCDCDLLDEYEENYWSYADDVSDDEIEEDAALHFSNYMAFLEPVFNDLYADEGLVIENYYDSCTYDWEEISEEEYAAAIAAGKVDVDNLFPDENY